MKKYICILIAVLSLSGCRKSEEISTCDVVDYRQALSMYVKRYCSQVILEYYVLNDPAPVNAYFGTKDLLQEYAGNARFQSLVGKICAQMDSISRYDVRVAEKGTVCVYEGEWTMSGAEWKTTSGQFTYEVAPNRQDYLFWRIETASFMADVDNFILRRVQAQIR